MKKFLVILMVVAMAAFLFVGCEPTPATYTLTMAVYPTGGGTTTPAVGPHPGQTDGTVVPITATPAADYEFDKWTGDVADPTLASTTVTMDADKTVTANFKSIPAPPPVTYDLTMQVSPPGSGTTIPAVGTHNYASGAVVDISAFPDTGYEFDKWTGDASGSADTTVTMDADKTVTAKFKELPTNVPIITSVPEAADGYVNKADAADGIKVHGTGDKDAEIYLYFVDPAGDIFAGTGQVTGTGAWMVDVAKADLGEDGDKILYATAEQKTRWTVSPHSNEIEFTLDTVIPSITGSVGKSGTLGVYSFVETTDSQWGAPGSQTGPFGEVLLSTDTTIDALPGTQYVSIPAGTAGSPLQMGEQILSPFTTIPATNMLMSGVVNWRLEVINVVGPLITMRRTNLTAGTPPLNYTFLGTPYFSTSWIPGLQVALWWPPSVGAYCLITTTYITPVAGYIDVTFDEEVTNASVLAGTWTAFVWAGDIKPVVSVRSSTVARLTETAAVIPNLVTGVSYSVVCSGVEDLASNPILPGSTTDGTVFP